MSGGPNRACRIASDLRAWLRSDNRIRTLYLVIVVDRDRASRAEIVEKLPEDSTTLWLIHINKARRAARQAISAQLENE
ncbi:MAG: hypothetical protein JO110_07070 [Acetobacteraceae bacterium]|nr:hypothetical protein [Acetobacteraceae bacterium]